MKNCLMTTISAGLWLESLEMHCKSFQCKYFIKCKTPDWIFYQFQFVLSPRLGSRYRIKIKLFRINNFSRILSVPWQGGTWVTLEFQLNYKSLYNVILMFLIDTKLSKLSQLFWLMTNFGLLNLKIILRSE